MYGTFADATAYFAGRSLTGFPTDLAAGNGLLRRASEALDAHYRWKGQLTNTSQSAAWPRKNVTDCEGRKVDSATVPPAIITATYELALLIHRNADELNGESTTGAYKKVKAGSVEVEFRDTGDTIPATIAGLVRDPNVSAKLRCYMTGYSGGGGMIPLRKS